jgi:hypothetical protein
MSTVTNPLTRNNWRASLVPAAAVIPAPKAYISFAAVKKLVVELWTWLGGVHLVGQLLTVESFPFGLLVMSLIGRGQVTKTFTVKKLECSRQATTA